MSPVAKRIELTEAHKVEILQRHASGQSHLEIKKEMNIPNGQQVAGVLSSQNTPSGQYLLKKAGLPGPTMPPHKPRKDLEANRETAEAEAAALAATLGQVPPPVPQQLVTAPGVMPSTEVPLMTGGHEPRILRPGGVPPISSTSQVMGFKRDGTAEQWMLFRTHPSHGHIFTFVPPFNISDIGPRFGDGDYKLERWIPGRQVPETMTFTVTGQGEPRFANGAAMGPVPMMNQQPQESASQIATAVTTAIKTGADIVTNQQAAAVAAQAAQAAKPAEARPGDKLMEKVLDKTLEQMTSPPAAKQGFSWEDYIRVREQERKDNEIADAKRRADKEVEDRARRADELQAHNLRMAELDKKHEHELARLKEDTAARLKEVEAQYTFRETLQKAHEAALAEINNKKTDWAMKEMQKAVENASGTVEEANEKLTKEITKLNDTAKTERDRDRADMTKERERDRAEVTKEREYHLSMLDKEREALAAQKDFNEQLLDIKAKSTQSDDKLLGLGEKLLNAINDRAKDAFEVKRVEAALGNSAVSDAVVDAAKNPQLMNHISQQMQRQAGGNPTEKDMVKRVDQIAGTPEFRDFMDEWCLHVEDKLEPELLFDSLQRKYQNGDVAVGELVDFMSGRRWAKAKTVIWPHISGEQQSTLSSGHAEKYYEKMRALINLMKSSAMKQWQKWEIERSQPTPPPAKDAPETAVALAPEAVPAPIVETPSTEVQPS